MKYGKTLLISNQCLLGQVLIDYLARGKGNSCVLWDQTEITTERLKLEKPDVIILDIMTLPFGGLETIAFLRQANQRVALILLLAGEETWDFARRLLATGISGLISRQSSLAEFAHCIREVRRGKIYIPLPLRQAVFQNGLPLLTIRELQIVNFMVSGATSREIAAVIGLSLKTVEVHRHNILQKLHLKKTIDLAHTFKSSRCQNAPDNVRDQDKAAPASTLTSSSALSA